MRTLYCHFAPCRAQWRSQSFEPKHGMWSCVRTHLTRPRLTSTDEPGEAYHATWYSLQVFHAATSRTDPQGRLRRHLQGRFWGTSLLARRGISSSMYWQALWTTVQGNRWAEEIMVQILGIQILNMNAEGSVPPLRSVLRASWTMHLDIQTGYATRNIFKQHWYSTCSNACSSSNL